MDYDDMLYTCYCGLDHMLLDDGTRGECPWASHFEDPNPTDWATPSA